MNDDPQGLDPLGFVAEILVARGALLERDDREALALLPGDVARDLGLPEEVRLVLDPGAVSGVPCGLGAPVLEALIKEARSTVPVAWARLEVRAPSSAQAAAAARWFALRNGLAEIIDVAAGEALYLAAHFTLFAEADDRHESGVQIVLDAHAGGEPDPALIARLDPLRGSLALVPAAPRDPGEPGRLVAARAVLAAEVALAGFREAVARRKERDAQRIEDYFAALAADARSPRRPVPEDAVRAKLAQIEEERGRKLADLEPRFAVRGALAPAALLAVAVPVARVRLRLRRRKHEGEVTLTVPAETRLPDRLACAACPRTTLRPVACDDRLHLLCETCAPSAQGRPHCRACNARWTA
jgi:hypothetical protein